MKLEFTVSAKPQPQGSSKAFRHAKTDRIIVTSDNINLKSFRKEVARCALIAMQGRAKASKHVPVYVEAYFRFMRPKTVPAKKRCFPVVRPDIEKCERAIYDGMTGIVYTDDAQIVENRNFKQYYERDEVRIIVLWD